MERKLTNLIMLFVLFASITTAYAQPTMIKELPSYATNFTSANGKLYYSVGDSLWKSNGTASGTVFVKEIGEPIREFTALTLGTFFYFLTNEPGGNTALWKSNGTSVNTFKIASYPVVKPLLTFKNHLIVGIDDGTHGYELWKISSSNNLTMLLDLHPGASGGLFDEQPVVMNDWLYFQGNTGAGGINLWRTNGFYNTSLVADLPFDTYFGPLVVVGNTIFFAYHNEGYTALWKSNGTAGGTGILKEFFEPEEFCNIAIGQMTKYNSKLIFNLIQGCGVNSDNLWESNGTEAGTTFIKNVNLDGYISNFMHVDDKIVFYASSQGFPGLLYKSDGTAAGTDHFHTLASEPVTEFEEAGDKLYFADHSEQNFGSIPPDPSDYLQLFVSDLTNTGTVTLESITGTSYAGTSNLRNVNDKLFFTTYNAHPHAPASEKVLRLYYFNPGTLMLRGANLATTVTTSNSVISVYPNPSEDVFNFTMNSPASGNTSVQIMKPDGTVIENLFTGFSLEGEPFQLKWSGANLSEGIYICKLIIGDFQEVKKIIISK